MATMMASVCVISSARSERDLPCGSASAEDMQVRLNLGDLPTWIAAVGTVGAFIAAFIQINTERRRRHENEERERRERHLAQARLIAAVIGPEERQEDGQAKDEHREGRTAVDLINSSSEPVYRLVVGIVYIEGTGPRTIEEMCKIRHPQGREVRRLAVTTASILPGGIYRIWIRGIGWSRIKSGRFGAEVAFTDRAGSHWIRRATGNLIEIPEEPLMYFKQFGMSAPYDLQTPERMM